MPRAKGSRNTKPTRAAIATYYAMLRSAADEGDVAAAAELIKLHHLTNNTARLEKTQ